MRSNLIATITHFCVPRLADWGIGILFPPGARAEQTALVHPGCEIRGRLANHTAFGSVDGRRYLATFTQIGVCHVTEELLKKAAAGRSHLDCLRSTKSHSAAILPLHGNTGLLGSIVLFLTDSERRFSDTNLELCRVLQQVVQLHLTTSECDSEKETSTSLAGQDSSLLHRQLAVYNHELRNSISSIKSWIPSLSSNTAIAGDKLCAEGVRVIERNVHILDRLTKDYPPASDQAFESASSVHVFDLNQLLEECLEDVRVMAAVNGVSTLSRLCAEPLSICGNQVRIHQVFKNLLINAIKYSNPGGTVFVTSTSSEGQAHIAVKDNGIGIDPALLVDIFAPFQRETLPSWRCPKSGSGLGLAVASEIVLEHRGRVWAESSGRGLGSTFHVKVPLAFDCAEPFRRINQPVSVPGESIRILVVDDTEDAVSILKRDLEAQGHTVLAAQNTVDAIELARRELPDLIISDIKLADSDGYDLIREIRRTPLLSSIPAIALSGFGRRSQDTQAKSAGFDAYLQKTGELHELYSTIDALTNKSSSSADTTAA